MSGIAGIIHLDGAPIQPGLIEKMTSAMHKRGVDGMRHWQQGSIALGHCMFRTTPESLEEIQPWCNEDESLVLVLDGRVDNWIELRQELLGRNAVLRNRSDAELVLRSYQVWGEQCLDHIIGEFAFFIWDARKQHLFAGRDAAGTRHFYYYQGRDYFAFASEIKGLLSLESITPVLNESRMLDYLVPEYDRDDETGTFYQGINRMPAGHAMRVSKFKTDIWRYWNPSNLPALHFSSMDECAEAYLDKLRIAVKCRLRSIGPVAAMLSGGLDSSSLVGLIRKEFQGELKHPLQTISLTLEDRENCTDWKYIEEMLKDGWIEPSTITSAFNEDVCASYLDNMANIDEPFELSHGLTYSLAYQTARAKGCNIMLDGMAGDVHFYSLSRSLELAFRKNWGSISGVHAAFRRHGAQHEFWPQALKLLRATTPSTFRKLVKNIYGRQSFFSDDLKLLDPETALKYHSTMERKREERNPVSGFPNDQAAHARRFTNGTISFGHEVYGQIAFNAGVEPRSPFSDRRMLEFAIQMPLDAKIASPMYKHLLRSSMKGMLPEPVRMRSEIGGHPGWQFYERLILGTKQKFPSLWSNDIICASLPAAVSPPKLAQDSLLKPVKLGYSAEYRLYTLVMLTQWLNTRSIQIRSF